MRHFTSTTAYVLYAASLTLCGLVWMSTALAAPNLQINYQGKLTDSSGVAVTDGDYSIAFALYTDPVSGGDIWNETATATVQNGLFSIMLGSSTSFAGVNFNQTLYLGINVEGDGEMSPRKILGTVPAAFEAQRLDGLATSSFLRSDADDTATGLLSFTGTTTFATSTFAIASTTILRIAGQEFSSLLGSGLTISGGALTANISESNLNIAAAPTDGYVLQASSTAAGGFVWQATSSLGFVAGEEVTLAGEDYLSLLGQQITANAIDPDNLSASDFGDFTCNGTTCSLDTNSVADNEIDYTQVTLSDFTDDVGYLTDISGVSFYDLSDTPAVYSANRILFQGGFEVTDNANFTFDGTNLGLGGTTGVLFGGDALLSRGAANRLDLASSDSFNIVSGALQVGATTVVDSSRRVFTANGSVGAGTLAYSFSADTNTGLYGTGSDVLGFVTNGVERARFDSSGNFGIGSSTPSRRLTIGGSAYIGGTLRATGTVQFDALTNGLLRANSSGVLSSVATSSLGIALSDTTGVLAATRGGTGLSSITQNQLLIGGAGNTWTQIATSSLGLGNGRFLGLTDTINSYNANRILFTDATGVVDSADFAFNDSSDTLTIGGLTLADGLIAFTSPSTTTIPNGEAYAFTIATSSTGVPLFRIDTTGGSAAVNIGSGSGDVFIGGVGSGSNLVFEESSTISGQGTNVITLGVAGDTFNVAPGVAFNIGTTTQNGLFTLASSTSQSLATFAQYGSGDIVSVFDGATEVFSILDGGNVGVGTSTPTSRLSVTGNTYLDGNLRLTGTLLDTTGDAGSNGQVLLSTGVGTNWVATSSLGFLSDISAQNLSDLADVNAASVLGSLLYYNGSTWDDIATSSLGIALGDTTGTLGATRGGTGLSSITQNQLLIGGAGNTWTQIATSSLGLGNGTFLGLSDTPGSYTASALVFASSTGTSLTQSGNLTYDGSVLGLNESGIYVSNSFDGNLTATSTQLLSNWNLSNQTRSGSSLEIYELSGGVSGTNVISGNPLKIRRETLAVIGTFNVSGALANFTDICTQFSGTCVSSADVLRLSQATTQNTGSALNITSASTNGGYVFRANDDGTFTDSTPTVITQTGDVGIGTTSPSSKLDVWGDFRVGTSSIPTLYVNTAGNSVGIGRPASTVNGDSSLTINAVEKGSGIFLENGNPTYGDFYAFNSTIGSTAADPLNSSRSLYGVANTIDLLDIDITSGTTVTSYGGYAFLGMSGAGFADPASSQIAYGNRVEVVGDTTGTTEAYGYYASVIGADTNYSFYGAAGNAYFADNVGIGTTSPTSKLTVQGDTYLAGTTSIGTLIGSSGQSPFTVFGNGSIALGNETLAGTPSSNGALILKQFNPTGLNYGELQKTYDTPTSSYTANSIIINDGNSGPYDVTGDITVRGQEIYNSLFDITLDNTEDAVAIGSDIYVDVVPFSPLNSGSSNTLYGTRIDVNGSTDGVGTTYGTYIDAAGGDTNYALYAAAGQSYFADNVGIGTSSPQSMLDVWGDFRVGTSSEFNLLVNTDQNQVLVGEQTQFLVGTSSVTAFDGFVVDLTDFDTPIVANGGNILFRTASGDFSFDTTNGGFDVNTAGGAITLSGGTNPSDSSGDNINLTAGDASGSFTPAGDIVITAGASTDTFTTNTAGAIQLITQADGNGVYGNVSLVQNGGNVGVGTTAPTSKLTVAGNTYIGGNLRATGTVRFDALTSGLLLADASGNLSSIATSSLGIASPFGASINANELASEDFGSFTCNGTICTLDTGSVATAQILDDTIDFADINYGNTLSVGSGFGANETFFGSTGIIFEGSSADGFETLLTVANPTADRTLTLQNVTGTIYSTGGTDVSVADGGTGASSLTAGGILFGNGTSAITNSGVLTNGQLLIGDGSGAPTVATLTQGTGITVTNGAGSITIASTLGTDIAAAEIANGDHGFFSYSSGVASLDTGGLTSANLASALTNETGTGNVVFSDAPTFTTNITTPLVTNAGTLALSASGANIITASTNGSERLRITSAGNVGIGTTSPNARLTVAGNINVDDRTSNLSGVFLNQTPLATASTSLRNFFLAGASSTSFTSAAVDNYAIGDGALRNLSTGRYNIGIGEDALQARLGNLTGDGNVGIGYQALQDTTSGTDNIAIGFNALAFNTSGSYNLGLGLDSLGQNSTGGSNVALGASALGSNETGARNVSLGVFANYFNVVGAHNVALGYSALFDNDATGTIAIGYRAADNAVSVDRGIFIGYDIDAFSTTQDDVLNIGNIIFGTGVDGTGTTLSSGNIGIGSTTPSSKLTVAGAGYFGGNLRATGTVQFDALTSGLLRANSSGILSSVATSSLGLAISDTTGTLAVARGGTGLTTFGGTNTVLYTTAADTLASNSNFTFNGTNLVLGGTTGVSMGGDVLISRGAANRLDVASGDSVNLVSGALQVGATTVVDSSRRVFTANGTVGAGSLAYSFSADTNTGLYGTGSDVLGFVTGGTERARIDSTGNVGVGTTAPVGRLSVSSASLAQTWSLIGSELNISGVTFPTLTALSANRAAFIDSGNDDLRVYEFNGSTWSLVGTELNIAGVGAPALTTLSPNRVAFIDSGNDDLRVYEFNGSTWSLVGTELNISGISFPALTTLSPNRVAFVDSDNEDLRVYEFNGSTWSQVGTEINISGIGFASLTTLSPNRVAFIDSGNDDLRVYEFNGSTWSQVGSELTIATSDVPALTTLSPNRVAFVDANNDDLRVYEFNGSTWSLSGTELNISGISFPALTTLSPNRVAFIDAGNDDLRVYQFSSPTFMVGNNQDYPFLSVSDAGYVTADAMLVNAGLTVNSVATGTNAINGTSSPALVVNGTSIFGDDIFARGNLSIGSTSARSLLTMSGGGFSGAGTFGIDQYLTTTNSVDAAIQFGNRTFINASNTATTTLVGSILRVQDNTTFGNTIRALEVQADRGSNTQGENTALSGFARTFGVRGTTRGDAGGEFEPAGGFFETEGTTQGNAIRGYSGSITTSALLSLFQDTSDFIGTGLLMNFGNAGGSFSSTTASNFIRLQNAGTTLFSVNASGTVTIGEVGGTTNLASLQIGYGGICVDDDGSCTASTSGRITATEYTTANSDLAEQYFSNENLEPGEIVYLKGGLSVGRANGETKDLILGVVSTAPGLTLGANDVPTTPGETGYPIALTGRVPIKLSNENGPIKKGDQLMLSSIPGVAMKASSTGMVVGIALEDFDESRAYSDTYISQYGENIIVPEYVPVTEMADPRINDGCYFGGGGTSDEAPCVPLPVATTSDVTVAAANIAALEEAKERALRELARERSEQAFTAAGEEVRVGQITMFVDLRYRYLDETTEAKLASLMNGTSTVIGLDGEVEEVSVSLMDRMIDLTSRFFDGVLTLVGLKAETVTTDELCIGNTCVNEAQLIELLNNQAAPTAAPTPSTPPPTGGSGSTPAPQPEPEPEPTPEPPATTTEPDNATSTPPAPEPEPTPDTGSSIPATEPPVTAEPVEEENPPAPQPEPTPEPEVEEVPEPAVDEVTTETPQETNP